MSLPRVRVNGKRGRDLDESPRNVQAGPALLTARRGYPLAMKLVKGAAALGAAKLVYDQARKPENQAKLKSAVAKAKASRRSRRK